MFRIFLILRDIKEKYWLPKQTHNGPQMFYRFWGYPISLSLFGLEYLSLIIYIVVCQLEVSINKKNKPEYIGWIANRAREFRSEKAYGQIRRLLPQN